MYSWLLFMFFGVCMICLFGCFAVDLLWVIGVCLFARNSGLLFVLF